MGSHQELAAVYLFPLLGVQEVPGSNPGVPTSRFKHFHSTHKRSGVHVESRFGFSEDISKYYRTYRYLSGETASNPFEILWLHPGQREENPCSVTGVFDRLGAHRFHSSLRDSTGAIHRSVTSSPWLNHLTEKRGRIRGEANDRRASQHGIRGCRGSLSVFIAPVRTNAIQTSNDP